MEMYGWAGKVLRVDLTTGKIWTEPLDMNVCRKFIGGRGWAMYMMYQENGPDVDPKSPDNKLYFALGPFTATPMGSSRMSIITKSPQTGFLNDGNIGGFFPAELRFAGYDGIIIQGRAEKPVYLSIQDGKVALHSAEHLWGRRTSETHRALLEELGDTAVRTLSIGPAGENQAINSLIVGDLYHASGRGAGGAVMGAKNLKAIAVRGTGKIPVCNPEAYLDVYERWWKELDPETCVDLFYRSWGNAGDAFVVDYLKAHGGLSSYNDQKGVFEGQKKLGSVVIREHLLRPQACFGCAMPSCTQLVQNNGKAIKVHAGSMMSMGSNLGIDDVNAIMENHTLCNDLGLDNYAALAIAWAFEAFQRGVITEKDTDGLQLTWGNAQAVHDLLLKIAYRDGFGNWLADGVKVASEHFGGTEYAMQVKGLETTTVTPRAMFGMGLAYAVNDMGADHCRCYPPYPPLPEAIPNHVKLKFDIHKAIIRDIPDEKGGLIKWSFDTRAVVNSLQFCTYSSRGRVFSDFTLHAQALSALTGVTYTTDDFDVIGERICNLERSYNVVNGNASRKDDTLPKRFLTEPYPDGGSFGTVVPLETMLDDYYTARGWDVQTGRPTRETLARLGLDFVASDFEKLGVFHSEEN